MARETRLTITKKPNYCQQCVHTMLAVEHSLNYGALLGGNCLQADVTQSPALHKHFNVVRNPIETALMRKAGNA